MFRTIDDLKKSLQKTGLTRKSITYMLAQARPSLRFATRELESDDVCAVGATRIGGHPDMAHDAEWPTREPYVDAEGIIESLGLASTEEGKFEAAWVSEHHALRFLAQVNLEDASFIAEADPEWPTTGRLLFFVDPSPALDWFSNRPASQGFRVLYDDTPVASLVRRSLPDDLAQGAAIVDHLRPLPPLLCEPRQSWTPTPIS